MDYFTDDAGIGVLAAFSDQVSARLDRQTGQWVASPLGLDAAAGQDASMHWIPEAEAATIAARFGGTLLVRIVTPTPVPIE